MDMHVPHALLQVTDRSPVSTAPPIVPNTSSPISCPPTTIRVTHAIWSRWTPARARASTPSLLAGPRRVLPVRRADQWRTIDCLGETLPSRVHGARLRRARCVQPRRRSRSVPAPDRSAGTAPAWSSYGTACIHVLYQNYIARTTCPITTISLVQGDCLGGGFEAALSSDIVDRRKACPLRLSRRSCSICFRAWAPIPSWTGGSAGASRKSFFRLEKPTRPMICWRWA